MQADKLCFLRRCYELVATDVYRMLHCTLNHIDNRSCTEIYIRLPPYFSRCESASNTAIPLSRTVLFLIILRWSPLQSYIYSSPADFQVVSDIFGFWYVKTTRRTKLQKYEYIGFPNKCICFLARQSVLQAVICEVTHCHSANSFTSQTPGLFQ
jgi:hypothetical protein